MKMILLLLVVCSVAGAAGRPQQRDTPPAKTGAQAGLSDASKRLEGTYESRLGLITVESLGKGQLGIRYLGRSATGTKMYGPSGIGDAEGTALLTGNTAVFKPGDTERCVMTLRFTGTGKIIVKQQGSDVDCGFGHNVYADGTYRRRSRRVEKFDEYGAPMTETPHEKRIRTKHS